MAIFNPQTNMTKYSKQLYPKYLLPCLGKSKYIFFIVGVLSVGLIATGCGAFPKESGKDQPQKRGAVRGKGSVISVDTAIARLDFLRSPSEYTGTTTPFRTVSLRTQVQGQLLALTVDVGDEVKQGQFLGEIDDTLLNTEFDQAQAELAALKSEVARAKNKVSNARADVERVKLELLQSQADAKRQEKLFKEGAIAKQVAEQTRTTARTNAQVLRASQEIVRTEQEAVAAARGRLSAQVAVVTQARERKSYSKIKSPITGVILERVTEPGNLLQPGNEILKIADFSRVKVVVEVSELELANIQVGQSVKVRLDAFSNQKYIGTITRVSPAADATARLVPVEIVIPNNNEGKIGSGLLSRITLKSDAPQNLVVPLTAAVQGREELGKPKIIKNGKIFVVTQQDGKTKVTSRTVSLGKQADGKVEVISGLQIGESYVVQSSKPLTDGDDVKLSILSEKPGSIEKN